MSGEAFLSGADSPVVRPRSARGEGDSLRRDLLDSAADLMAAHGSVDKVSVRAVAAAAGVSPTAVYGHFDSHTDLLWAAVQYCFDEFLAVMEAANEATDDVYERFRLAGRAYVRFATEQNGKYRVMFSSRVQLPTLSDHVGMHAFEDLVGKVRDILDDREDPRDPRFVALQVWTWIHGIVDLMTHPAGADTWPPIEQLLDELSTRLELVVR